MVAQIGHYRHALDARLVAAHAQVGGNVEIERQRRHVVASIERVALDDVRGQHGDLAAGHVHRRQPAAGDAAEVRIRPEAEARRGDVDADAQAAVRCHGQREGIVDFRGVGIVDGKSLHRRQRQVGRIDCRRASGETRAAPAVRKMLEEKASEVQLMAVGQGAAALQQAFRTLARGGAGSFQRLGFRPVAIRLVEQLGQLRRKFRRQAARLQFSGHALDGERLLTFLLLPGQRRLEDLRRGLAETPLALAVKVDRRGVQAQQHGSGLDGGRRMPGVFGGELGEAELLLAASLPEKLAVDLRRRGLGLRQQFARAGRAEAQQHVGGLQLDALAAGRVDLQGSVVVGNDGAGLEGTILFEEEVHGRAERRAGGGL